MKIQWFGNTTFLLTTNNGKRILIDPFNIFNTFNETINADFITCSKNVILNSFYQLNPNIKIINSHCTFNNEYIKIKGYKSNSDSINGLKRGSNIIYIYQFDNIKICHLGYLGEMLNCEMINILKNADILFIPIGNNICLNGSMAYDLSKKLSAKYIFPMCYKKLHNDFYLSGPKEFLSFKQNITIYKSSCIYLEDLIKTSSPQTILINNSII